MSEIAEAQRAVDVDPATTVLDLLAKVAQGDIDGAVALTTDDVTYQNVPMRPARGAAELRRQLGVLTRSCTAVEIETHHIAANGNVVLTERTDTVFFGREPAPFWVCGTFEVRDGKVAVWRDHFDWAGFAVSAIAALARAGVKRVRRPA